MLLEENEQEAISMIIFWFQIFEMRLIMTNSTKQKTKTLYFVSNIFKIMSTLVLHLMTMMRRQFTGVEWVEISKKNFARFFGPRMFVRSYTPRS